MATEYFNDAWRIPNNKNQSLVSNYSMEFDGSGNDSITIPSYTIPENSTVSFWIKSSLTNPQDIIISGVAAHYYPYFLLSGGNIRLIIKAGSISNEIISDVAWVADTWFHIAITGENGQGAGSTATYYINGVSKGTSLHRAPTLTVIGDYTTASLAWNGQIDQVCFFDYALPATGTNSIATLYGGGTAVTNPMGLSPAPVAYYQLGDQSVDNGANYLVPNNSLQDYVFNFVNSVFINITAYTITPSATVSAWFNTNSPTVAGPILGRSSGAGGNYYGYIDNSGGKIRVLVRDAVNSFSLKVTNVDYNVNTWYHLAITQTNGGGIVYINGQYNGAIGARVPELDQIGNYQNTIYFNGKLSNIAIWNTNLSSTDIEAIYNNGSPNDISSLNPTHWWKLNAQDTFDGSNWTINDYGSGSNDGTSSGMTSANLVTSDLQQTSGYSPYALSFDGTNQEFDIPSVSTLELYNTDFTISFWCKVDANVTNPMFFEKYIGGGGWALYVFNDILRFYNGSAWTYVSGAFQTVYAGLWTNVTIVGDLASTNLKCYINGSQVHSSTNSLIQIQNTNILTMAGSNGNAFSYAGELSNVAIWSGTALNAAQVTEVYNQGVPINLNTFSGNKPNHWWQLGSNSSFNSNSWTCLDEGISASTNPLTSAVSTTNMSNDDIVDGVGYSASGLGTSSIEIVGDAPYSSANGISENMDVLDRTTDVPPTV